MTGPQAKIHNVYKKQLHINLYVESDISGLFEHETRMPVDILYARTKENQVRSTN